MLRIVIDMNLSPHWTEVLCKAGHTASHWSEIGHPEAPDPLILHWAAEHQHLVFTHDLDFGAILAASGEAGPSVMQMRSEDTRPTTMAPFVLAALRDHDSAIRQGCLLTIDPLRSRIRLLPLLKPEH